MSGEETARTAGCAVAAKESACTVLPMLDAPAWGLRPASPMTRPVTPIVRVERGRGGRGEALGLQLLESEDKHLSGSRGFKGEGLAGGLTGDKLVSGRRPASPRRPSTPRTSALQLLSCDEPTTGAGGGGGLRGGEEAKENGRPRSAQRRACAPKAGAGESVIADLKTQLGAALKSVGGARLEIIAPCSGREDGAVTGARMASRAEAGLGGGSRGSQRGQGPLVAQRRAGVGTCLESGHSGERPGQSGGDASHAPVCDRVEAGCGGARPVASSSEEAAEEGRPEGDAGVDEALARVDALLSARVHSQDQEALALAAELNCHSNRLDLG